MSAQGQAGTHDQDAPKGDNPDTAGAGSPGVRSETPENAKGRLSPSAPEDANTTPGSSGEK